MLMNNILKLFYYYLGGGGGGLQIEEPLPTCSSEKLSLFPIVFLTCCKMFLQLFLV